MIPKHNSVNDRHQLDDKISMKDFVIRGILAEGAYAQVYLAQDQRNLDNIVLKRICKSRIIGLGKQSEIFIERFVLQHYCHKNQGMIRFHGCFQDEEFLYFALEYCPYGDFDQFIKRYHSSKNQQDNLIKCYIKQIVEMLIFLHTQGIAHLDLKPSNLVIDKNYNFKLIDFSTCYFYDKSKRPPDLIKSHRQLRILDSELSPTLQLKFVGTAQFISPEMLENTKASKQADLWSLGCIIFQAYHNRFPFDDKIDINVFDNILNLKYKLDPNLPKSVADLIQKLLQIHPMDRLGAVETSDILQHEYFQSSWMKAYIPWQQPIRLTECLELYTIQLIKKASFGMDSDFRTSCITSPQKTQNQIQESMPLIRLELLQQDQEDTTNGMNSDLLEENQGELKQKENENIQVYHRLILLKASCFYCFPKVCLLEIITPKLAMRIREIHRKNMILYQLDLNSQVQRIKEKTYQIENVVFDDLGMDDLDLIEIIDTLKIMYV